MELQQLRYFKVVADTGKISAAADSLFISAPALSATIGRLERELEVRLFNRTNNRIILNKQGEILLRYVNQVLDALNHAQFELKHSLRQEREHIRVAVTHSNLWVSMICAFSLEYPQYTLSYTTIKVSQFEKHMVFPQYDFLLAEENDLSDTELIDSRVLIPDDRPVLVVHPEHPLAKESTIDLRMLTDETFFLPSVDQSLHRMVNELLTLANLQPGNALECSYMVRRSMVMTQRGVSFSTVYSSKSEEPSFHYIPITSPVCTWKHQIFYPKGRAMTPEKALFFEFAQKFFRDHM